MLKELQVKICLTGRCVEYDMWQHKRFGKDTLIKMTSEVSGNELKVGSSLNKSYQYIAERISIQARLITLPP